jgi:hypothetical protein
MVVARRKINRRNNLIEKISDLNIAAFVKRHISRRSVLVVCLAVASVLVILGMFFFNKYRTYDEYKVLHTIKMDNSSESKYMQYQDFVIKYSGDGISYIDSDGTVWDEAYQMTSPIVDICQEYIAVADKNTNTIYVYNKDGKEGKITTSYPIIKIEVASQGVVAALQEDNDSNYIEVFDREGNKLIAHKSLLNENGYPLDFAISDNGENMAVSYVTVNNGFMSNKVAFYNFAGAGKNTSDKVVGEFDQYDETLVPMVRYVSDDVALAIGEDVISIYKAGDKPKLSEEINIQDEIQKVFYSDKYIGLVLTNDNSKNPYRIEVYDLKGNLKMKEEIKMEYDNVDFSGDNVLMYDGMNCRIISFDGVVKFKTTFKGEVHGIIPVDGSRVFLLMTKSKIQKVKLK